MSGYNKQSVQIARAAITARGVNSKTNCTRCAAELLRYCQQAERTGDLLACELSDETIGLSHMADDLDWWLVRTHEELRPECDPYYGMDT